MIFAHLLQGLPTDSSTLENAISLLEKDIKNLENSSVPLEKLLPWFTGVVAIGVAMELWVIWHDRRDDMQAWRRGIIRPPDRPSTIKFMVEIASVLLITGGIVGELWIGIRITSINGALRSKNGELRTKSDQWVAMGTKDAGDAKRSAHDAEVSAGNAKQSADDAQGTVKVLGHEVTALSPRILTPVQQRDIAKALNHFWGSHQTVVESYSLDGEGTALALQLISVLHQAEIPVSNGTAGSIVTGGFEWGVSIRGPAYEQPFMASLQDALTNIGRLKQVVINGPERRVGTVFGGRGGMGGKMTIGGGGGPPIQQPPPKTGPVRVMVGIRPPSVIP